MPVENLQALLLRHALVTREQLTWAVEFTRDTDRTWLEQLLLLGTIDEDRFCACVSHDLCLPRCGVERLARLAPEVLLRLPTEVAVEHRVLPLAIEEDGDLHVAMIDPTDSAALEEVSFFAAGRVMREVATPTSIAWALHQYHGVHSALWPRSAARPPALVVNG
jgi:hypothetical protein